VIAEQLGHFQAAQNAANYAHPPAVTAAAAPTVDMV
jgi:hypothetical protein